LAIFNLLEINKLKMPEKMLVTICKRRNWAEPSPKIIYRMARNIAGTLIEVGRGRLTAQDVKEILKAKNRIYAGPCAPARGLCLMDVKYKKDS
jgi:hypothetical protein